MMRIILEPAYVLHHRPWRDSSLILDLLTRDHGRIAVAARGARRPKAKLYGLLQPFRPLLISAVGRGEMGTLTGAEPRSASVPPMVLPGRALISGFYVNELVTRLLARHDPHIRLFDAYERVIAELGAPALDAAGEQRALRLFERILLDEIGYGLVLDHDVTTGRPIDAGTLYEYHPERGPVAIGAGDSVRERTEAAYPAAAVRVHGRSLIDLARGDLLEAESLRETKPLMRMALGICLGGRPLRSRELFHRQYSEAANPQPDSGSVRSDAAEPQREPS